MSGTVCLSFDFDAVSLWINTFRSASPSAISRGEYGAEVGLPRVLDMLSRQSVPATFFIPGVVAELYPASVRMIQDHGHEVGTHGDTHDRLVGRSRAEERASLERGIERLMAVTGDAPIGFRAPAWELSFDTISILLELGIRYDSSQFASDFVPYRARVGDRLEDGVWSTGEMSPMWEFPIAWELDDVPYFLIQPPALQGRIEPETVGRIWQGELDYMAATEPNGVFTLTMHPQVIGRGPRIAMLENLVEHAKATGCRFTTLAREVDRLEQQL